MEEENDLFQFDYRFIQQKEMHGVVIGGNIRCFLKLAGTEFMPDLKDKILLLESYRGTVPQMEAEKCAPDMVTLVCKFAPRDLPIAVTPDIGHGTNAKAIRIGGGLSLFSIKQTF